MELGNANFQLSYDTVLFDVLKIRKRFNALPLKVRRNSCIRIVHLHCITNVQACSQPQLVPPKQHTRKSMGRTDCRSR
jgi:hypothetical protein